jgi:hypothetical protein
MIVGVLLVTTHVDQIMGSMETKYGWKHISTGLLTAVHARLTRRRLVVVVCCPWPVVGKRGMATVRRSRGVDVIIERVATGKSRNASSNCGMDNACLSAIKDWFTNKERVEELSIARLCPTGTLLPDSMAMCVTSSPGRITTASCSSIVRLVYKDMICTLEGLKSTAPRDDFIE